MPFRLFLSLYPFSLNLLVSALSNATLCFDTCVSFGLFLHVWAIPRSKIKKGRKPNLDIIWRSYFWSRPSFKGHRYCLNSVKLGVELLAEIWSCKRSIFIFFIRILFSLFSVKSFDYFINFLMIANWIMLNFQRKSMKISTRMKLK